MKNHFLVIACEGRRSSTKLRWAGRFDFVIMTGGGHNYMNTFDAGWIRGSMNTQSEPDGGFWLCFVNGLQQKTYTRLV